jgi:pseudouridine-5'-phosphate glycosidase
MNRLKQISDHLSQNGMPLAFSDEVKEAMMRNQPIVALESTIISHGMNYPENLQTALEVERLIRKEGEQKA